MTADESTTFSKWVAGLEAAAKKLQAQAKAASATGDDPFAQRELLSKLVKGDEALDAGLLSPELRKSVEAECLEATAEFWERFGAAAGAAGWNIHGTTQRRLVQRAFFLELKDEAVVIDGLPGKHTPHVPGIVRVLGPLINGLRTTEPEVGQFCDMLARAYDLFGGQGEITIEAAYRQCVLLAQPPAFWAAVDPAKFLALTRPVFRAGLTAVLERNVRASGGREVRLLPTVNRKDVWEVFSPAEGRIVQVGRIAFIST